VQGFVAAILDRESIVDPIDRAVKLEPFVNPPDVRERVGNQRILQHAARLILLAERQVETAGADIERPRFSIPRRDILEVHVQLANMKIFVAGFAGHEIEPGEKINVLPHGGFQEDLRVIHAKFRIGILPIRPGAKKRQARLGAEPDRLVGTAGKFRRRRTRELILQALQFPLVTFARLGNVPEPCVEPVNQPLLLLHLLLQPAILFDQFLYRAAGRFRRADADPRRQHHRKPQPGQEND